MEIVQQSAQSKNLEVKPKQGTIKKDFLCYCFLRRVQNTNATPLWELLHDKALKEP